MKFDVAARYKTQVAEETASTQPVPPFVRAAAAHQHSATDNTQVQQLQRILTAGRFGDCW
jgi:hypothetical protein